MNLELRLGAMWELLCPISEQLKRQGLRAKDKANVEPWQADAQAISQLAVRGFITDRQAEAYRKKLVKKIAVGVVPIKRRAK